MAPHDDLLDAARTATGLDDFGEDSFREGLELLVRSLRTEARLTAAGEVGLRHVLVGMLGQRLRVEDWYRRHPEIDDEPLDAPLITLGLPRTGSTALSFLLAEDPRARSLRRWEATEPCPPPATVTGPDPRLERARAALERQHRLTPDHAKLVPGEANGPQECHELMALDFTAHVFQAFAHVPAYSRWLLHEADLTPTYAYLRRVLKLLQWGSPARPWRLKNPSHLLWLDHLDQVFPDARFVMTHRDPTEVIVSVAHLYADVGARFSDDIDPHYLGELNVEHWSVGMDRALAFRAAGADDRFHDIDFRAMQHDPVDRIRGLYAWLGEPVTDEFEAGMRRWWRDNGESREPNTRPDPATYGLDPDRIAPLFAHYNAQMKQWTS
jgi:hypothetical protein